MPALVAVLLGRHPEQPLGLPETTTASPVVALGAQTAALLKQCDTDLTANLLTQGVGFNLGFWRVMWRCEVNASCKDLILVGSTKMCDTELA